MFTKTLIATAAVATVLTAAAPAPEAQAKTKINIDVNIGGGGYGYYPGYYAAPAYPVYYGISCNIGRKIVRNHGFNKVAAFDCSRPVFQYTGWKFGQPYKIRVNMDGQITRVRPL
jgi:hypothetical protein